MKKNIGIFIPPLKVGGVFQFGLSIADSLINYSDKFNYKIIHYDSDNPRQFLNIDENKTQFVPISQKSISPIKKILHFLNLIFGGNLFLIKDFDSIIKKNEIDILIYPTPFTFSLPSKTKIPYISFLPNLMHRYYPNFPEFGLRQKITHDIVYKYYAKNSVLNVVDSEQGAQDIYKFLGISKEKSRIIPFVPASYIYKHKNMDVHTIEKILAKYNLPEKFLFYPAQFRYHKNHSRLIAALNLIKQTYHVKIPLVLVGLAKSHYEKRYREILELIKKLNLGDQIIHLGYVSDKEIVALYKKSTSLVFPSLFGPTDIPCLEAMLLGAPVVCSNLFEIPKQVGSAGLFFNSFDVKDMAEKIYKIWMDEKLRQILIERGRERTKNLTLENYAKEWEKVIEEALTIKNSKQL